MSQRPHDDLHLSPAEGEALIERLAHDTLRAEDRGTLIQVVRWLFWLLFVLQEAKLSLTHLRRLLFGPGAPAAPVRPAAGEPSPPTPQGEAAPGETAAREVAPDQAACPPKGGHRPGTGRLGAAAYPGATQVACRHEDLAVGQRCPVCGHGTLYALPAGVELRLDGHALLSAVHYIVDKLRCSACGQIFTAGLPAEVGQDKYSARARAVLVISRYYLGVPGYRLQGYQAMVGVPVPDATQWDQIEVVGDCAYKVFDYLETEAAQGELIFHDDTAVRILALMQENQALHAAAQADDVSLPPDRTGMHTTAVVVKIGEHTAILYYSSRRHAGENLQRLLDKREPGLAPPLAMSDALASNTLANDAAVIRCHCLAHGRRKFSDLADAFPQECQVVLEVLSQVFDHEEQARQAQLSPAARLAYHQAQSQPLMETLRHWLATQMDDHLVEPNSTLGKAIGYLQHHWETLTRFLAVPGAPLDNNVAERALKLFIRQRNNSLFYKTTHSAYIASLLTSLIATCLYAGVNALDYLVALQEHRAEVWADPAAWVPWRYQAPGASP
jgi:transposase